MREEHELDFDLNQVMVKPLYFGLFINVLIPAALLFACYYLDQRSYVANRAGNFANALYYIIGALSLGQIGVALWWRHKRLEQPMIRRRESFAEDLAHGLLAGLRPIFLLIAAIAVYGIIYFFLTGRFEESLFVVLVSFLAFQIVRPRTKSTMKVVEIQEDHVAAGRFLEPGS